MATDDFYLNLQIDIVTWRCSRNADSSTIFFPEPGHIFLGMESLVWWIDALPLQNPSEYSFIIKDVTLSSDPGSLSRAAEPNLPAKIEFLLAGLMESVRRVDEALDKFHAFSRLVSLAVNDKRWWIIVDAKITARLCNFAKEEARREAAETEAAKTIPPFPSNSPVSERSGWGIDNWTAADELWARSFFPRDNRKGGMKLGFQGKSAENGNVVRWCSVRDFGLSIPTFAFDIALPEFVDGDDDALLRIGVANDRAVTVVVNLEESFQVFCFQEGLETGTSLGLRYLLPEMVREYILCAIKGENYLALNVVEGLLGHLIRYLALNVVEGLLGHLIRYLAFPDNVCLICGRDRLLDVPQSRTCSLICTARKQCVEDVIAMVVRDSDKERRTRREEYVRNLFENSPDGCTRLGNLLGRVVVDEATLKCGERTNDGELSYADAVGKVAEMNSTSVELPMEIPISDLRINNA